MLKTDVRDPFRWLESGAAGTAARMGAVEVESKE